MEWRSIFNFRKKVKWKINQIRNHPNLINFSLCFFAEQRKSYQFTILINFCFVFLQKLKFFIERSEICSENLISFTILINFSLLSINMFLCQRTDKSVPILNLCWLKPWILQPILLMEWLLQRWVFSWSKLNAVWFKFCFEIERILNDNNAIIVLYRLQKLPPSLLATTFPGQMKTKQRLIIPPAYKNFVCSS